MECDQSENRPPDLPEGKENMIYNNYDCYLNQYPTLSAGSIKAFEYTRKAIRRMDQVLSSVEFEDGDAESIFSFLLHEVDVICFGDYLKRYIYRKSGSRKPFEDFSLREYQDMIRESFRDNRTPFSWQPVSRKPGSIIKRWLTQQTVFRQTVFLIGFGLRMNDKDVSDFLTKGIRETDFNFYDPKEVVCWHCFHCGKRYPDYRELMEKAGYSGNNTWEAGRVSVPSADRTRYWEMVGQNPEAYLFDEDKLLPYLSYLRMHEDQNRSFLHEEYRALYHRLGKICHEGRGDLPSRIENRFCSGIPRDRRDNLTRIKDSALAETFMQQKMSRQRIDAVLKGRRDPDRFDLITFLFFIYSQMEMEPNQRRDRFIFEVNDILIRCHMTCLLFAIPYEAFVIMCLMTDDPLAAYSEVWEMSYRYPEDDGADATGAD